MKPSHRNPLLRNLVLTASICLTLGQAAHAASIYWDTNGNATGSGPATGTWGVDTFWSTDSAGLAATSGTLPTADDDVFIAAGTTGTTGTITISGAQVAGSVTIQEPAGSPGVTISGGTSLTVGGGSSTTKGLFVTGNGTHTVSTPLILSGATTIQNGGTGIFTVSGGITGTGNLTLNNNNSTANAVQLLATQVNTVGSISNSGSSTGTTTIGNAVSTTGTGGLSATVTSVSQNSASSTLQFLNANNSAYTGNYDINAGILSWAGTNTGPGVGTNLGTITATNPASVINLGATSGTAAATMNIVNNAVSGKVNNNILVRAGSTGTKTIAVALNGNGVTFSTTGAITLDDNVTLSPSTGPANLVTFNPNGLISDGANGPKGITKAGAGNVNLSHAHPYSGATNVTAGILALTAANGSLPSTSAIAISGGTLQLNNTGAANNTNRLPDSSVITMSGGTLDFKNDAAAASNFSETVAVTAAVAGTINASQAALGQTSTLTIGNFTRSSVGTLSFNGTGLGVDARNLILFATPPSLTNGAIPWATYNNTAFASYDNTNGIISATTTDIDAQGSTIVDAPTSNLRILPDGAGSAIALGSATTSINTLVQANVAAAISPTIDTATKTLRTNSILVASGARPLTIGVAAGDGTLTPALAGGELLLNNSSANGLTVNAVVANNTSASSVTKVGSGDVTFAGNNSYTGSTTLAGGVITAASNNAFGSGTVTLVSPTRRLAVANGVTLSSPIIFNGGGEGLRGVFENVGTSGNATIAGPITISGTLTGGGHFASTTGNTLTISGPITSTTSNPVVRAGVVIFSGTGSASNYATLNASGGITRLGASNALLPSATLDMAGSAESRFDLNGFNQTLAGITRTPNNNAFIGNSSTTSDSTLTTTGTSNYTGSLINALTPGTMKTFLVVDSGSLTLSGAFSGQTATINNGGTLNINTAGGDSFNPLGRLITVNNGGVLKYLAANKVQNDTVIDIKSGATFEQNGQGDTIGHITGAGSITNLNSSLTLSLPAVGSPSEFSGTISGTSTTGSALVINPNGTGASAASTLILSGDNSGMTATSGFSSVNVQGGRLVGRNSAAFGPAGQILSVGASALTLDPTIEFGNNTALNAYVLNIGSGNTGTIELNRATPGAALVQSAAIPTFGNGTLNFEKGANVTSGTPVMQFPALSLSAGSAGLGAATLNPVGVDISVLGGVTRLGTNAGNLKLDGTSTGNSIAGEIQDNGANKLNVTKSNTGTWTLGGANSHTGTTTVTGGTLNLTGSLASGSAVTVGGATATGNPTLTGAGGTVGGTLNIAAAGGGAAGTVNPGTAGTTGILNAGATTIGGTYACDVVSATADVLAVTGNLDITSGATFALNTVTPVPGTYTIATYSGALTGTFTASPALPSGYSLDYGTGNNSEIKLVVSASGSAYGTWGAPYGLTPGTEGGDLDNDGLKNFEEFAFGLIPNNGSSVNPILVQLNKTTGQFTYQRLTASGLSYTIWTSTDLATWTPDGSAGQAPTTVGANQNVVVTLSATPKPLTATKLFVRVTAN